MWKYKPEPEPEPVIEIPTDEELIDEIKKNIDESKQTMTYLEHHKKKQDEKRANVKEEASQPPLVEKVGVTCLREALPDKCVPVEPAVSEPVKVEPPLSDTIRCESGPDHYRCRDETSFSNNSNESTSDK